MPVNEDRDGLKKRVYLSKTATSYKLFSKKANIHVKSCILSHLMKNIILISYSFSSEQRVCLSGKTMVLLRAK